MPALVCLPLRGVLPARAAYRGAARRIAPLRLARAARASTPRSVRSPVVARISKRSAVHASHVASAAAAALAGVVLLIDPAATARKLFTVSTAGDLSVLTARIMGVLCLAFALLPAAMASDATPDVMRSFVAVLVTFASCMTLFLASGNLHLLTTAGRVALLAAPAFLAAVYGYLVAVGFFL